MIKTPIREMPFLLEFQSTGYQSTPNSALALHKQVVADIKFYFSSATIIVQYTVQVVGGSKLGGGLEPP